MNFWKVTECPWMIKHISKIRDGSSALYEKREGRI